MVATSSLTTTILLALVAISNAPKPVLATGGTSHVGLPLTRRRILFDSSVVERQVKSLRRDAENQDIPAFVEMGYITVDISVGDPPTDCKWLHVQHLVADKEILTDSFTVSLRLATRAVRHYRTDGLSQW